MCATATQTKGFKFLSCRQIIYLMVTTAVIFNNLLFFAMSIAIVSITSSSDQKLNWTEREKQIVLGMSILGYAMCKIPGGRLAETVGPKITVGISTILGSMITFATPFLIKLNFPIFVATRFLLGFFVGIVYPAIFPLSVKWSRADSRSSFMIALRADGISLILTNFLGGYLISLYDWSIIFFGSGGITLLWTFLWWGLVYDSPKSHPRISCREREDLEGNFEETKKSMPWKQVFKSRAVWVVIIDNICYFVTIIMIQTELPSFIQDVFNLEVQKNGLYSSIPMLAAYVSSIIFNLINAQLTSRNISKTILRKSFQAVGFMVPATCLLLEIFIGADFVTSMVLLTIVMFFSSASTCGHHSNVMDISPNFAGTISGVMFFLSAFFGFGSTQIIASLLEGSRDFQKWSCMFWIMFGLNLLGAFVDMSFSSTKLQEWDS